MTELSAPQSVTVVSVCFNSMSVLPAMIASVPDGTPVVLVDNASADGEAVAELAARHGAALIRNPENRGFGVACNQGAAVAATEFLLFLNPDAMLAPDAIDRLVAAAGRYPAASAMNPRIIDSDGAAYFKRRSPLMPRREWMPRGWPDADREVTVLSGAALFVRKAAFDAVGRFDPQIFLYHEDDDLSRRLKAQSGPLMFIRDALVTHLGGSSSMRTPETAALKGWHMGRSRVYAMRKHKIPFGYPRAFGSAAAQLVSPLTWMSKRRRAKQWAVFRGLLSAR